MAKKTNKTNKTSKRKGTRPVGGSLAANLSWFEIALGHDGLFRGRPDPLILVGLYHIANEHALLLCRGLARVNIKGPYPASVDGNGHSQNTELVSQQWGRVDCLALLVIALEEDGGSDARRVYAELERAPFTFWRDDLIEPVPYALGECATSPPHTSENVEVLMRGEPLREQCNDDELIGATLSVFHHVRRGKHPRRLHFRAPDGKNDWTCEVALVLD